MPRYRLYPLTLDARVSAAPLDVAAFNDSVAMRWAMRRAFPNGCDIFQGARFIGRVHGAETPGAEPPPDPPTRSSPAGEA